MCCLVVTWKTNCTKKALCVLQDIYSWLLFCCSEPVLSVFESKLQNPSRECQVHSVKHHMGYKEVRDPKIFFSFLSWLAKFLHFYKLHWGLIWVSFGSFSIHHPCIPIFFHLFNLCKTIKPLTCTPKKELTLTKPLSTWLIMIFAPLMTWGHCTLIWTEFDWSTV